jgi:hypothetical protein
LAPYASPAVSTGNVDGRSRSWPAGRMSSLGANVLGGGRTAEAGTAPFRCHQCPFLGRSLDPAGVAIARRAATRSAGRPWAQAGPLLIRGGRCEVRAGRASRRPVDGWIHPLPSAGGLRSGVLVLVLVLVAGRQGREPPPAGSLGRSRGGGAMAGRAERSETSLRQQL